METKNIMIVGVGGQGTLLASKLLGRMLLSRGYDVKVSEVHGMSQRGGSVQTVVSFGEDVHTMIADEGRADVIVSFEAVEALRNQQFLAKGGTMFVNDEEIVPVTVNIGNATMPEGTSETLKDMGAVLIPAGQIARDAGSPKSTNVVLMGALSTALPFAEDVWCDVITKRVPPKTIDANLAAFKAGREAAGA